MNNFYYNYKDLFKAPRMAIGPQRIALATLGIMAAHLVYLVFSYFSIMLGGYSVSAIWSRFGLFPCAYGFQLPFYSYIIYWIGFFATGYVLLLMSTSVSRAAYMYLRENLFYTYQQALKFSKKKALSLLGIYITFLILILPFIIGAIIMAIIGRIPWFGELLNAFATLPYIFAGMLLVFFTLSLLVSFFYGPIIISTSEEDGFGAAVQSLHLTWGQPWRLITYGITIILLEIFGILFFAFVLKIGLIIYSILFMPLMHSLAPMLNNALRLIQLSLGSLHNLIVSILGESGSRIFYLKENYAALSLHLPLSTAVSSYVVYFFLLIAGYMTVGYGEAVANTALVISYVIFDRKMTDTDLLKRKDSEIEEEDEDSEPKKEDTKDLGESGEQIDENASTENNADKDSSAEEGKEES